MIKNSNKAKYLELIEKFKNNNISFGEFKFLLKKIKEVWAAIYKEFGGYIDEWEIDPFEFLMEKNELYTNLIENIPNVVVEGHLNYPDDFEYQDSFPTHFLWTDYKKEIKKYRKTVVSRDKALFDKKVKSNKKIIDNIKRKLTKEDLKLVMFRDTINVEDGNWWEFLD